MPFRYRHRRNDCARPAELGQLTRARQHRSGLADESITASRRDRLQPVYAPFQKERRARGVVVHHLLNVLPWINVYALRARRRGPEHCGQQHSDDEHTDRPTAHGVVHELSLLQRPNLRQGRAKRNTRRKSRTRYAVSCRTSSLLKFLSTEAMIPIDRGHDNLSRRVIDMYDVRRRSMVPS